MSAKRTKKGACGYHHCEEKKKLSKCKYCKKLYCQVHIKPLMPGKEEGGESGHVCPQAYEDLARTVAKDNGEVSSLQNALEKSTGKAAEGEVSIEADWVIDVKTDEDIELVKETMLGNREWYRGVLVNINPELELTKRNQVMKWLTEFAREKNWKVTVYSDTKIHFAPPRDMETGKPSVWDRFINWLTE
jgi:hypothetical protein